MSGDLDILEDHMNKIGGGGGGLLYPNIGVGIFVLLAFPYGPYRILVATKTRLRIAKAPKLRYKNPVAVYAPYTLRGLNCSARMFRVWGIGFRV